MPLNHLILKKNLLEKNYLKNINSIIKDERYYYIIILQVYELADLITYIANDLNFSYFSVQDMVKEHVIIF